MNSQGKATLSKRYFFTRGEKATDAYNQFWIRYKGERVLLTKYGRVNRLLWRLSGLAIVVMMALCSFTAPMFALPALTWLGCTFLLWALWCARTEFLPTHLSLSDEGLRLYWFKAYLNVCSPLIGWDRMSHLSMTHSGSKEVAKGKDKTLEFNIISRGYDLKSRLLMSFLGSDFADGWLTSDRSKLRFKLDGIASSDDRKRLQLSLKKYLPSYKIDPGVTDELKLAVRPENYTDLWMDALEMSGKRKRIETLTPGCYIRNGQYQVQSVLGGGGQAIIYDALEKTAAGEGNVRVDGMVLKEFVLPAHAGLNVRKRVVANIEREAKMLQGLQHPNIVVLHDFFVEDQRAYLVMEKVPGKTLKVTVEESGPMPEKTVIELAILMCDILNYLHSKKPPILHRDFTPDNLMLSEKGALKLIDFNVAQLLEAEYTNSVVGKHAFIPPEQFRGEAVTGSDLYSLGGTLFFMLTGQEPEPITRAETRGTNEFVSPELDAIVARATEPDHSRRYQSSIALMNDLKRLQSQRYGERDGESASVELD